MHVPGIVHVAAGPVAAKVPFIHMLQQNKGPQTQLSERCTMVSQQLHNGAPLARCCLGCKGGASCVCNAGTVALEVLVVSLRVVYNQSDVLSRNVYIQKCFGGGFIRFL